MSTPRANANQSLYLARLLLHSWQRARDEQDVPAAALARAFLPAVRQHLVNAYGWFLLEVTGNEMPSDGRPPACCAELPRLTPGKAEPGEVREFNQLERDGWLAQMLAATSAVQVQSGGRTRDNLASPAADTPDLAAAEEWAARLDATMERMRDFLEES
ncbi:MAG: DUF6586 family protein [Halioglobus sp.]|nr:DUF6586 family protein [Halioglobus sp.]